MARKTRVPALGHLGHGERQVGRCDPAPEQILEEGAQMRRWRLIAERLLARQKVLHERYHIPCANCVQADRTIAKAVIEEAISEAQCVIYRARAKAPLFDEIGFIVREQLSTRNLRLRQLCWRRHADIDQVLREPPGEVVEPDRAL